MSTHRFMLSVLITGANVHDKWLVAEALDAVVLRGVFVPLRHRHLCLDKVAEQQPPAVIIRPSRAPAVIRDSVAIREFAPTREMVFFQTPVPMTAVASSNIAEVGYSDDERILFVRFQRGGLYRYFGVGPDLFRELLASSSKGSFVQSRVASGPYSYDRIG